jgi:membrane-associated protease RseP (regulator of RpoE activity)
MGFKDSSTFYKPTWDGEFVYFIYHLFWWIMTINLLVALFNMMPLGILDGGRFFFLAMAGIFKSERVAKKISKAVAYLIAAAFVLMMVFWFIGIL